MAGGCVTKAISNFFKEIFLVFSIVLGEGLLWDTSIIPYTYLPIFTNIVRRDRPRNGNLIAICRILLYFAKSTKFY